MVVRRGWGGMHVLARSCRACDELQTAGRFWVYTVLCINPGSPGSGALGEGVQSQITLFKPLPVLCLL